MTRSTRTPAPPPRPLRRALWATMSIAALGPAIGLVLAAALGPSSVAAAGGVPIQAFTGAPPRFAAPTEYHVVYRVSSSTATPLTEELWVDRPFDSYDTTSSGSTQYLTTVARLGAEVLKASHGAQASLINSPPAPATNDVRLDAMAGPLLRAGLILIVGRSSVMGRSCVILRSSGPLRAAGPLAPLHPGSSYVDSCVDQDGIVLSEATYKAGVQSELRRAVSVSVGGGASRGGDFQLPGQALAFYSGGGSFTPLTLSSSPPGLSWAASTVPAGFQHAGRYAVVPSQPQVFADQNQGGGPPPGPSQLGLPNDLVTELDDTFVSGPDVIIVQQGVLMGGGKFNAPPGGQPVQLGVLGRGQLTLSALGPVLTAEPANGSHFVRISGTVPPSVLLAVARGLQVEAPGPIVPLP